jgi:hypothetical protein
MTFGYCATALSALGLGFLAGLLTFKRSLRCPGCGWVLRCPRCGGDQ